MCRCTRGCQNNPKICHTHTSKMCRKKMGLSLNPHDRHRSCQLRAGDDSEQMPPGGHLCLSNERCSPVTRPTDKLHVRFVKIIPNFHGIFKQSKWPFPLHCWQKSIHLCPAESYHIGDHKENSGHNTPPVQLCSKTEVTCVIE